MSTFLATVSTAGIFGPLPVIAVDETRDGELVDTHWFRTLTPAEEEARDWDALLAPAGWSVTGSWEDHGGYWTATVEQSTELRMLQFPHRSTEMRPAMGFPNVPASSDLPAKELSPEVAAWIEGRLQRNANLEES